VEFVPRLKLKDEAPEDPDQETPLMKELRVVMMHALAKHDAARQSVADAIGEWQERRKAGLARE
jgi:hypothetical protein